MSKSPWRWSFAEDVTAPHAIYHGVCLRARKGEEWGKEFSGNNHKLVGSMLLQLKNAEK
jgi:hypothetical protein